MCEVVGYGFGRSWLQGAVLKDFQELPLMCGEWDVFARRHRIVSCDGPMCPRSGHMCSGHDAMKILQVRGIVAREMKC